MSSPAIANSIFGGGVVGASCAVSATSDAEVDRPGVAGVPPHAATVTTMSARDRIAASTPVFYRLFDELQVRRALPSGVFILRRRRRRGRPGSRRRRGVGARSAAAEHVFGHVLGPHRAALLAF